MNVEIVTFNVIDELLAKIEHAATHPNMAAAVQQWFADHGEIHTKAARSYAVVGDHLMFVHPCPDGVLLPFDVSPEGEVTAWVDPEHAGESFD